jgi:hypothetical protein
MKAEQAAAAQEVGSVADKEDNPIHCWLLSETV